jgi:hypothetical protein
MKSFLIAVLMLGVIAGGILGFKYLNKQVKQERAREIQRITTDMIEVQKYFEAEGFKTCQDFYDDGNNLPSAQYNYNRNGIQRNYYGKLYWLRCNTTVNRPVIIRLKNRVKPDQFVPPFGDWGYIYDDTKAQKLHGMN